MNDTATQQNEATFDPSLCPNCGEDRFSSQPAVNLEFSFDDELDGFSYKFGNTVVEPEFRCDNCGELIDDTESMEQERIVLKEKK